MKENNSKLEQIKQLFNEGIISVDELIRILSRLKDNQTETLSRKYVTDYLAEESLKEFPVEQVVDFMHRVNWKWALEEVTVESFKKQVYELVKDGHSHLPVGFGELQLLSSF